MTIHVRILQVSLVASVLAGCASKSFVTDEGSASFQHVERLNKEFADKGVPPAIPATPEHWLFR